MFFIFELIVFVLCNSNIAAPHKTAACAGPSPDDGAAAIDKIGPGKLYTMNLQVT